MFNAASNVIELSQQFVTLLRVANNRLTALNKCRCDIPPLLFCRLGLLPCTRTSLPSNRRLQNRLSGTHEGMQSFDPLFALLSPSGPNVEPLSEPPVQPSRNMTIDEFQIVKDHGGTFEV